MAVIAAASPWGDYNDYTIATLRTYPRLRGTVILRPSSRAHGARPDEARRRRRRAAAVHQHDELPDVTTLDYRRFLRRIADLDWHVHPHIECEKLPQLLPALELAA